MSLYNIKSSDDHYIITKFDDDLNVESSYEFHKSVDGGTCHCPAGQRPSCRHRQMFSQLVDRVDSAWFLDFDTRAWVDPTGEAALSEPEPEPEPKPLTLEDVATPFRPSTIISLPDSHPFRRRL